MGTQKDGHADQTYDVVVVGARVAGASTAMLLARAGHRVAVVDRVRMPSDTLSTHLVWPAGVVQLRRWGVLDEILGAGTPALEVIRNDVDGLAIELPVWPESGVDAVCAPRRTVLDPALLGAAERAGATVIEGVTVDGLSHAPDGTVDGVVGHRADGRPLRLAARFVVGADGWRSRVARDAGAVGTDARAPSNAVHYAYWAGLEDRGVEFWYRTTGLMAGVFPTNDGACVYVNCRTDRASELRRDLERGYRRLLAQAAPDLAARLEDATMTSPVRGTPGLPGFRRHPYGPGWVLVGDAGITKDPASAHGITAALRDAELAAIAIGVSLRDPASEADAMRRFHEERERMTRGLYDLSWAMASYEWDAATLLDLQSRFADDLVSEARDVAELDAPWGPSGRRLAALGRG
jgi:2-polyprenyl-6-methoxyphenol hydroxylase-like FAD-dependent oxidoreductase